MKITDDDIMRDATRAAQHFQELAKDYNEYVTYRAWDIPGTKVTIPQEKIYEGMVDVVKDILKDSSKNI